MYVECRIVRFERFQNRPVRQLIEIVTAEMRIYNRAVQAETLHPTLDLLNRTFHVLGRKYRQSGETIRMAAADFRQSVVCQPRQSGALSGFKHLHTWRGQQ